MLQLAPILLILTLFAPLGADAEDYEISDEHHALISRMRELVNAADSDLEAKTWPYKFGTPGAKKPHLVDLGRVVDLRDSADPPVVGDPFQPEARWLLIDLETNLFWLLESKGYFGPMHYYGPVRLTSAGEIEVLPDPLPETPGEP